MLKTPAGLSTTLYSPVKSECLPRAHHLANRRVKEQLNQRLNRTIRWRETQLLDLREEVETLKTQAQAGKMRPESSLGRKQNPTNRHQAPLRKVDSEYLGGGQRAKDRDSTTVLQKETSSFNDGLGCRLEQGSDEDSVRDFRRMCLEMNGQVEEKDLEIARLEQQLINYADIEEEVDREDLRSLVQQAVEEVQREHRLIELTVGRYEERVLELLKRMKHHYKQSIDNLEDSNNKTQMRRKEEIAQLQANNAKERESYANLNRKHLIARTALEREKQELVNQIKQLENTHKSEHNTLLQENAFEQELESLDKSNEGLQKTNRVPEFYVSTRETSEQEALQKDHLILELQGSFSSTEGLSAHKLEELERELERMSSENKSLIKRGIQSEEQFSHLQIRNSELEGKVYKLAARAQINDSAVKELQLKLVDYETIESSLQDALEGLNNREELTVKLRSECSKMSVENEHLAQKTRELESQLLKMNGAHERLVVEKKELEGNLLTLSRQKKETDETIARGEAIEENKTLQRENHELTGRIEFLELKIADLKASFYLQLEKTEDEIVVLQQSNQLSNKLLR